MAVAGACVAPAAMALGIAGILYGAIQAFGQTDIKRLVAYTSVSHLGFVLLAIFVWNRLTLQGALITIISHGISTGALFVLAGLIQERIHTREMDRMGGLWDTAPRISDSAGNISAEHPRCRPYSNRSSGNNVLRTSVCAAHLSWSEFKWLAHPRSYSPRRHRNGFDDGDAVMARPLPSARAENVRPNTH